MNNTEWELDESIYDSWFDDDEAERKTIERTITNEDFLIHRASSKDFRAYVINELNKLYSILSSIKEVAN